MSNKSTLLERPAADLRVTSHEAVRWFSKLALPRTVQARLEDYAGRNTEGLLSADEIEEYKLLVDLWGLLSLAQTRADSYLSAHPLDE